MGIAVRSVKKQLEGEVIDLLTIDQVVNKMFTICLLFGEIKKAVAERVNDLHSCANLK